MNDKITDAEFKDEEAEIKSSHSPILVKPYNGKIEHNFYSALKEIMAGKKMTRLEWGSKDFYGLMKDSRLSLHKPEGKVYDWVLNDGDIASEDWVIV